MVNLKRKYVFIFLLVFLFFIIGTNLVTFYLAGGADHAESAEEVPQTIIRYEPQHNNGSMDEGDYDTSLIENAIKSIQDKYFYPVELDKLVEGAVRGIVDSIGDPYLQYLSPEELDDFLTDTRGSYAGIGVRIIESDGDIVVFETFADSPAARSGLQPGDRILEADGNELSDQGIKRAVELLRGPSDTTVEILIKRPGSDEPLKRTVGRAEIQVETVFSEMLDDGLGYIKISSFDGNTGAEFVRQFESIEQSGLSTGLILDLRNNPGGLVEQAVEVGRQIIPEGEIVRLVGPDDQVIKTYLSSAAKRPYPLVVLINEDSASASELLAGAVQDREVGVLVGKSTYGKASVQQLEYIDGESAILMTMAKYFTPAGYDIDEHGVEPDFELDMPEILRYYRYFHPDSLAEGDYGDEVEMLQQMLEQLGLRVEITGYFDRQTALALRSFQDRAGLELTGEFDDTTWVELRSAIDVIAREKDEQLNYAKELIKKPGLLNVIGGID
ncbi:MAG: S41 family peptidase [Bacillota bacterium]